VIVIETDRGVMIVRPGTIDLLTHEEEEEVDIDQDQDHLDELISLLRLPRTPVVVLT
jgi:hypothetical protein